jgi:hypothetical protein
VKGQHGNAMHSSASDGFVWRLQRQMLEDVAGDGIKGGDADL